VQLLRWFRVDRKVIVGEDGIVCRIPTSVGDWTYVTKGHHITADEDNTLKDRATGRTCKGTVDEDNKLKDRATGRTCKWTADEDNKLKDSVQMDCSKNWVELPRWSRVEREHSVGRDGMIT
jgi:hypothetical protein